MSDTYLERLAKAATPGERFQMSGKYVSFDYGETPQVFRAITDADEAFIIACSPDRILALLAELAKFTAENARLRAVCEAAIRYVDHWNDIDTPDPPDEMGTTNGDQLLIDLNLLARAALAAPEPK